MTTTSVSNPPSKVASRGPSILQMALSAFFAFILLGAAVVFVITGVSQFFSTGSASPEITQAFMVAASLAFAGALVIPSAWYAWKNIAHPEEQPASKPEPRKLGLVLTLITLVGSGLALWIGNMVAGNDQIAWLILPPLNIIATGLPALWVIYFGTRGLLPNPPRHIWGVFASGLVLGPLIILVIELFMLVGAGILAIISIMLDPTLAPQLQGLVYEMQNLGINPQALLDSILPFLLNPGVLFIGASFVAVLVPLVEELIKPIGVWFMAGQKITPAQGFGFGVLSGAGFGLFENLGNTSAGGQSWALLAGSRISTLFLHSFTAGLVGWALAYAWSERRFLRLAITFIIAVLIHGLWNGMAVLSAAASLDSVVAISLPTWFQQLGNLAAIGIFILGLVVVICFFGFNANLRKNYPTTLSPAGVATIHHPDSLLATSESSLNGPSSEGSLPINPPPASGGPSSSDIDPSLPELSENPQQSETNS